jgi:ABC-type sugar transport system permease subunit
MASASQQSRLPKGGLDSSRNENLLVTMLKYLGLMILNAFALVIFYTFMQDGNIGLGLVIAFITVMTNVIVFVPRLMPLRWMVPGLALVSLLVVYPIIYTVQTSFTNYGDGHLFSKQQAINLIADRGYVPENARTYSWIAFRAGEDEYALWLTNNEEIVFARPGEPIEEVPPEVIGLTPAEDGPPLVNGFTLVDDPTVVNEQGELVYPEPVGVVQIASLNLDIRFLYDVQQGLTLDQEDGVVYDTIVYQNEAGQYAFWLTESGIGDALEEALIIVPGEDVQEVDLTEESFTVEYALSANAETETVTLSLPEGFTAPDAIGPFQRINTPPAEELAQFTMPDVSDGFATATTDLTARYVFDTAQALILDIEDGNTFDTFVYAADEGEGYALYLDGGRETRLFRPDQSALINGVPATYQGYEQILTNRERAQSLQFFELIDFEYFGEEGDTVGIANTRSAGRPYIQRFVYDAERDGFEDLASGAFYVADDTAGNFVAPPGVAPRELIPGYRVDVGLFNFRRLIEDENLRGPLIDIFVWTVVFALLSVFTTFTIGLLMAMILNDSFIPGKKIVRSLLIIPYAIPGVIGILVWRGLLNQNLGLITNTIVDIFGYRIPWFADPTWAKIAIIMVNLWLGYPYMMLICSGALQAIPSEVYEAAAVDGARPWQRFWNITLPLLLVTVGPLLIASFTFNFNNYLMIELLTRGDPPIPGSPVPAGYTDILISYTYGVAFGSNRGADYGYASAITIVIFLVVALITLFQYRFTRSWEETGENV